MAGTSDISVVVCTYDIARFDQLQAALTSLTAQTLPPEKVIVVDDGSAEVATALARRDGPETVVVLDRNGGLSAARNAGVGHVESRWVAFLDDDAEADPQWLEQLDAACRETSAVGAGGWSEPVFADGSPGWLPPELLWTVGCSYAGLPTSRALVRNVFGGCAMFRTDLLRDLGGFDVTLGRMGSDAQGGEEAEFCVRVSQQQPGARFVHEPKAVIRHHVPASRASVRYVLERCRMDGQSKGRIARLRGGAALSAESSFVARVPLAMLRHLLAGRPRAAAVLAAGVLAAALGYVTTRFRRQVAG